MAVRALEDVEDLDSLPAGHMTYVSPDQLVEVVIDSNAFEFWIEASPAADPAVIEEFLARYVFSLGLELIPEHEDAPEVTERGWTRIYASPAVPVDDSGESIVGGLIAMFVTLLLSLAPVTGLMTGGSPLEVLLNH